VVHTPGRPGPEDFGRKTLKNCWSQLESCLAKICGGFVGCRKKYWTVVHTPSGLAFPRLAIELPPELDIVVFSSGGRAWQTLNPKP